ncbi:MAG TPA: alginate lyase family protein [Vicinamibacterales bacterium]|nr:alginate lyase family protein [Vicinamibacterales bacterium]
MSVVSKIRQLLRRVVPAPAPAAAVQPPPSEFWTPGLRLDDHIAAQGSTIAAWLQQRRAAPALYADLPASALDQLRSRWPDRVSQTIAAADRVCAHEFDLLGSGPMIIMDRARPRTADGYEPIDWNVDPILKQQFPLGFPHKAWNPSMRPGLADIKWPWEIGRCQHWVTLGQAYRFAGDERYVREIIRQHADFVEQNPTGVGVQFVCTMDVAIRACNWVIAFDLIRTSPEFTDEVMARVYRSLFEVGQFIIGNLENKYEVTSNHFLSNIVGLYAVGASFASLPAGQEWVAQCREWIEQEMRVQVLEDGMDYESSVPYHRLVAELFLGAARLGAIMNAPFTAPYLDRLQQMIEFHEAVLRPDGMMPQVGDADDGRLHIFSEYGSWRPQDGRHLLGPAGAMFGKPGWTAAGGDVAAWEAAWWGFDPLSLPAPGPLADRTQLFPHAGLAVTRRSGHYLLVTNARVGTNGFGNHKHNDLLGFEYHSHGVPLMVDPGSYLYTSDPDARNLFRSTRSHNTLSIDDTEQNDIRLDYLFRMFETSTVEHRRFDASGPRVTYEGRHTGYERLATPVTHERVFEFDSITSALTITDRLTGSGGHRLAWHFHLAPGVAIRSVGKGRYRLEAAGRQWEFVAPETLTGTIATADYSPSFGVKVPCQAIDFAIEADLSAVSEMIFSINPVAQA